MPKVSLHEVGVAVDMHGCPNRCQHCWLTHDVRVDGVVTEEDAAAITQQVRTFCRAGETKPEKRHLRVSTWMREPDYGSDYRQLYEREQSLSDLLSKRAKWGLLSVWRLARDAEYAEWAHTIGLRAAKISFFGMEQATDWGYGRRGAFRDALTATERLLQAGIRPRWQVFFTKKLVPDLRDLIATADSMKLRQRCEALRGDFAFWLRLPSPVGQAFLIEHLRPTPADLDALPREFLAESEERIGRPVGLPEGKLVRALADEGSPARRPQETTQVSGLWFNVMANFDLYSNLAELSPAYRLGNLKTDGLTRCIEVLEQDATPGLKGLFQVPTAELARRFGRPQGQRLYDEGDLKVRWARMWALEQTEWEEV
ncbi:MAG: radical SAM protein [Armatimonadetes bacterium]|nr:radical SAM protein [Armatimonadota bacterium]